jgi:hypothetical protein
VTGATWQGTRGALRVSAFAGTSATGLGVPFFLAQRTGRPFAMLTVEDSLSPRLRLFATVLGTSRQTAFGGVEWRDSSRATLAATAGVGANQPFASLSGTLHFERLDVRASYSGAAHGYHRADLPVPAQPRLDGPAVEFVVRPRDWLAITATRMTFVKDSGLIVDITRATGSSVVVSAQSLTAHGAAGMYFAETAEGNDLSGYLAAGRTFGDRVGIDAYTLATHPRGQPIRVTPIIALHERVTPTLVLDQVVTFSGGQRTVSFGGSYAAALAEMSFGYQLVHAPFDPVHPFIRTLNVRFSFNIGNYRATLGTTVLPTGRAQYDASAVTYLYLGGEQGMLGRAGALRMARYVVRGIVTDQARQPVAGAAIAVGGTLVFTDSFGRFFMRVGSRRPLQLSVRPGDFMSRGAYEVVSAPEFATPDQDGTTALAVIILRLAR